LVALAIEKAEEATGTAIKDAIREVANPPGKEVTTVSEALTLIREGQEINYQGASGEITFDENGDVSGAYCRWYIAENGSIVLAEPIYLDGPEVIPTPEATTPAPAKATPAPAEVTPTPVKATPAPAKATPTQTPAPKATPKPPGFEAIFAVTGILAVAYLRMWRKAK
jgi:cell division septation protein DedD